MSLVKHCVTTSLVPWRCSCRGTQRQLGYGSSPGISVLGKMNRIVYSQAHVSTVAPVYIEPSFLWSPSSSLALYIPFQCQLWIAICPILLTWSKYRSRRHWIQLWISWLSFNLSKMSSFLMWSLLVTPSIFRRHDTVVVTWWLIYDCEAECSFVYLELEHQSRFSWSVGLSNTISSIKKILYI